MFVNSIVSLLRQSIGALACLALSTSAAVSQANLTYPTQAVRLVVGFAAGGGNDIVARVVADKLSQRLGQPVIVENKPGAGGVTAAAFVAGQPADGLTLLVGASGAMAIAPVLTAVMPFDTLRDFSPVSLVASFPLVMIVSGKREFKTVHDLISWSKANQEKANYATSSPTFTLSTELFKTRTGAQLQNVPYRGSGESVTSVLGEQTTTAIVDMLPAMPLIESGQIRALAVTSGTRVPELPDVPTMQEAGVPGLNILIWTGIFVRKGTSPEILAKLESEIRGIMQMADVKARLRSLATDAVGSSSDEFRATIQTDLERWSGVAKAANIPPQ
jgi:tripartite-type tricarboxylate transporter receptor subunit TctC